MEALRTSALAGPFRAPARHHAAHVTRALTARPVPLRVAESACARPAIGAPRASRQQLAPPIRIPLRWAPTQARHALTARRGRPRPPARARPSSASRVRPDFTAPPLPAAAVIRAPRARTRMHPDRPRANPAAVAFHAQEQRRTTQFFARPVIIAPPEQRRSPARTTLPATLPGQIRAACASFAQPVGCKREIRQALHSVCRVRAALICPGMGAERRSSASVPCAQQFFTARGRRLPQLHAALAFQVHGPT